MEDEVLLEKATEPAQAVRKTFATRLRVAPRPVIWVTVHNEDQPYP